jgi:hypothetical protein
MSPPSNTQCSAEHGLLGEVAHAVELAEVDRCAFAAAIHDANNSVANEDGAGVASRSGRPQDGEVGPQDPAETSCWLAHRD